VGRIFPRVGTTYPYIAWSHRPRFRETGTVVDTSWYRSTQKRTERADEDASCPRFPTVSLSLLLTHIFFSPWVCVVQNEPLDEKKKKKKKKKKRIKTTSVVELLLAFSRVVRASSSSSSDKKAVCTNTREK
jgi:hypothetical protein